MDEIEKGSSKWGRRFVAFSLAFRAFAMSTHNEQRKLAGVMFTAMAGCSALALALQEEHRELTERMAPVSTRPLFLAPLHAVSGEIHPAFATLERALAEREFWLPLLRLMPELTRLASDPRWPEFVAKVEAVRRASCSA